MTFRSKVDRSLLLVSFSTPWLIMFPAFFLFSEATFIMLVSFILAVCFMWWYIQSITFVFDKEYLLIKSGPVKKKILYQNITRVTPTTEKYTGFRISTSDKGLELSLKLEAVNSMKILPRNKHAFITELRKRCPHAVISENQEFE
ncbi:PH domain-containing protein [Shouchella patagoniensis]|uniref:PH domain-containing protein n=1 Tax=Shouchella patagoniensis TaxID=228576 RepID=UPI000994A898|nr:PH domain-containing protein [Shouchella patagoniensis]